MNAIEVAEAAAILVRFAAAVLGAAPGGRGAAGSELRRSCGLISARATALVDAGREPPAMLAALVLAREAGATLVSMGRVRTAMLTETPRTPAATTVAQTGVRLSLTQEARILAGMTFVSRQDVEVVAARMHTAFEAAETAAADAMETATYRALMTLHAAVTRHLAETARPLPRLVPYTVPTVRPAPVLALRFYGDAERGAELAAENRVVHPAFMPRSGRMLAN